MKLREVRDLLSSSMKTGKIDRATIRWLDFLRTNGWPSAGIAPFTRVDLLAFVSTNLPAITMVQLDSFLYDCDEWKDTQEHSE